MPLRTFVYVDGFNLYYRAVKGTPHKWLNVKRLCELALGPRYRVEKIKYYTARVSDKFDPGQPRRQQAYLKALQTVSEVEIYYGKFLVHPVKLPLQTRLPDGTRALWVMRTEEKGSDVNLASHLVHDAHRRSFEAAAVVSSDTDLVEPVRIVAQEIGLPVCLLPPQMEGSKFLKAVATEVRRIGDARLRQAQSPDVVQGDRVRSASRAAGELCQSRQQEAIVSTRARRERGFSVRNGSIGRPFGRMEFG